MSQRRAGEPEEDVDFRLTAATIGFGAEGAHSAYLTWQTPGNTHTRQCFVDFKSDSPESKQIMELILKGRIR